jgi:hypothetical protein
METIETLTEEISRLKEENNKLREKVAFFENHPTIAVGIKGESVIARIVSGDRTIHNQSYDVTTNHKNLKLEIKFSRINNAVRSRITRPTYRWAWAKPFGESGEKIFDQLILVGEKCNNYMNLYLDAHSPYVIFDVPYHEIMPLTIQTNSGRFRSIQLTCNPHKAKSAAAALFAKFQLTAEELKKRYEI